VLAWTAWDTGSDPLRFARGVPYLLDFVRRMVPPDLRVLPAALAYATRIVGFRQGRVAFDGPPAAVTPAVVQAIYGAGDER